MTDEAALPKYEQIGYARRLNDGKWVLKTELSSWANPTQWEPVYRKVDPR